MIVDSHPSDQVDAINYQEQQKLLSHKQDHPPTQPSSTSLAKCSTCACQREQGLGGPLQRQSCPNITVQEERAVSRKLQYSKGQMVL